MSRDSIMAIADHYKAAVFATRSDEERIELFIECIREFAADRARDVYLAVEAEAERRIKTEDRESLRVWIEVTVALAGCEFAKVAADLPGVTTAEDRAPFEQLAAVQYDQAFNELLRTVRRGGNA